MEEKTIKEKIREILNEEAEFKFYNDMLLEYCFPDKVVVRFRDYIGILQTWRRSRLTGIFEVDYV